MHQMQEEGSYNKGLITRGLLYFRREPAASDKSFEVSIIKLREFQKSLCVLLLCCVLYIDLCHLLYVGYKYYYALIEVDIR